MKVWALSMQILTIRGVRVHQNKCHLSLIVLRQWMFVPLSMLWPCLLFSCRSPFQVLKLRCLGLLVRLVGYGGMYTTNALYGWFLDFAIGVHIWVTWLLVEGFLFFLTGHIFWKCSIGFSILKFFNFLGYITVSLHVAAQVWPTL